MLAPAPRNRAARIAAIRRYDLGGRHHEGAFDGIVALAAQVCRCPVAVVSIVHADRQAFEARCGLDGWGTGLDASICAHAILQDDILEIPDARLDTRTRDNPLVDGTDDAFRFYAGAQIVTPDGIALGTLCVLDRRPRRLGDEARAALRLLAEQVMRQLQLHEALGQAEMLRREVDHRVKNNLANVGVLARMAARAAPSAEVRDALETVRDRIQVMVELHAQMQALPDPQAPMDGAAYLSRIAAHLEDIAPEGVSVDVRLDPLAVSGRQASALGVLLNEMVSNACKHGFPDGGGAQGGRIAVEGRAEGGDYRLSVRDDGVGAGAAASPGGLGRRIMEASAAQLGGALRTGPDAAGHRAEIVFPTGD